MTRVNSPPRRLSDENPFPADCAARYTWRKRIASGGYGAVYLAHDTQLDRAVAVKLLLADVLSEEQQVQRFDAEARATAAISHRNVIEILDHGAEYGIPWMVFELVEGRNLRELLDAGPLPVRRALEIAMQVADGLHAAHAQGIVHRDVKPDNVLLTADGTCKIADFGIAKWTGAGVKTATGSILGTPAYIAPEQVAGDPASPASDVYALGITLFELLTGAPPFVDDNPVRLLERHLVGPVPAPSVRRSDLPRSLDAVVLRALEKRPRDRQASAHALREELAALLDAPALPPQAQTPGAPTPTGDVSGSARRTRARATDSTRPVARPGRPTGVSPANPTAAAPPRLRAWLALGLGAAVTLLLMLLPVRRGSPPPPPAPPATDSPSASATAPLPSSAPSRSIVASPAAPGPLLFEQRNQVADWLYKGGVRPDLVAQLQPGTNSSARIAELGAGYLENYATRLERAPKLRSAILTGELWAEAQEALFLLAALVPPPVPQPMQHAADRVRGVLRRASGDAAPAILRPAIETLLDQVLAGSKEHLSEAWVRAHTTMAQALFDLLAEPGSVLEPEVAQCSRALCTAARLNHDLVRRAADGGTVVPDGTAAAVAWGNRAAEHLFPYYLALAPPRQYLDGLMDVAAHAMVEPGLAPAERAARYDFALRVASAFSPRDVVQDAELLENSCVNLRYVARQLHLRFDPVLELRLRAAGAVWRVQHDSR